MTAVDFSVGSLVPFDGGDSEEIAASGRCIATFGAAQATWWVDGIPHTVELPNIRVRGARWSIDCTRIFVGTGIIDMSRGTWSAHPAFEALVQSGPPGKGSIVIQATSWAADGQHAAVLLGWSGPQPPLGELAPPKVIVLDLAGGGACAIIPADDESRLRIVGNRVVISASVVRVWTFDGTEVAALPATRGAPLVLSGGDDHQPVLLVDADWSVRVVDTATWTIQATWPGEFLDVVAVPGGLLAVDFAGRLHAGCLGASGLREVGAAETGVQAAKLAACGDGRIVITGAGPAPVHALAFHLKCGEG